MEDFVHLDSTKMPELLEKTLDANQRDVAHAHLKFLQKVMDMNVNIASA